MSSLDSQLAIREYGDKALVMNRSNGRWAVVPARAARLLDDAAEGGADAQADHLRSELNRQLDSIGLRLPAYVPPHRLSTLILKITKVCNYRCKYCYDMEPDDKLTHLPFDTAVAALEEAIPMAASPDARFLASDLSVILHGGEPTLFPDLIERIVLSGEEIARRHGKRVKFSGQTNLSRLSERMVRFSADHNVQWGISMDGPAEINDTFRVLPKGKGTYEHFEAGLRDYPEFVRSCGVLSTVTAANVCKLLDVARHFRDVGMPSWDWSIFQPIGQARHQEELFGYLREQLVQSWNDLYDAVLQGEFDGFEVQPVLDYLRNMLTGPGPNLCMREGCGAARDLLTVTADGSIEACDSLDRKGPFGHIGLIQLTRRDSLERALASDKAAEIRSRDVRLGRCRECDWVAVCGGTCLARADGLHGVAGDMCAVALTAFDRIARSMAQDSAPLHRYWRSLYGDASPEDVKRPPKPVAMVNGMS